MSAGTGDYDVSGTADADIWVARSIDAGATWSIPARLDGASSGTTRDSLWVSDLIVDRAGTASAAFQLATCPKVLGGDPAPAALVYRSTDGIVWTSHTFRDSLAVPWYVNGGGPLKNVMVRTGVAACD